jgi:hypothetical protein
MRLEEAIADYLDSKTYSNVFMSHAPEGENILIRSVWQKPYTDDGLYYEAHEIVEVIVRRKSQSELINIKKQIISDLIGLHKTDEIKKITLNREEPIRKNGGTGWLWVAWFEVWAVLSEPDEEQDEEP